MLEKLKSWLEAWQVRLLAIVERLLMRVYLPGFRRLPLYPIAVKFFADMMNRSFMLNSSAMAYSFFLSIFPTLIFLFSLLPYVPIADFDARLLELLSEFMPKEIFSLLEDTFLGVLQERDLSRLSISLFIVFFLGIKGVRTMSNAFNSMDSLHMGDRNFIAAFWIHFTLFIAVLFMGALATLAYVLGEIWISFVGNQDGFLGTIQYLGALIVSRLSLLGILLFTLNIIYRRAPTYNYRWRVLSPGSLVAAILLMLAFLGLGYYFTNFSRYNNIYGSLGAVIMLMVLFYWVSFVLLTGFNLNSSIEGVVQERRRLNTRRDNTTRAPQNSSNLAQDNPQAKWTAGARW